MLPKFSPNHGEGLRRRSCQLASAGDSICSWEGLAEHVAALDLNQALEAFASARAFVRHP